MTTLSSKLQSIRTTYRNRERVAALLTEALPGFRVTCGSRGVPLIDIRRADHIVGIGYAREIPGSLVVRWDPENEIAVWRHTGDHLERHAPIGPAPQGVGWMTRTVDLLAMAARTYCKPVDDVVLAASERVEVSP